MDSQYCGTDACGDEIRVGDRIIKVFGEVVLVGNVQRFLEEFHGAEEVVVENNEE